MIPQRTLGGELFGNGLKARVTACRKRIRRGRVTRKTDDDLLPDLAVAESSGRTFPSELTVVRQSCVEISDLKFQISEERAIASDGKLSDLRSEIPGEEQEVGIT